MCLARSLMTLSVLNKCWFSLITSLCFTKLDSGQSLWSNKPLPNRTAHLIDSLITEGARLQRPGPHSQGSQKQCKRTVRMLP